MGILADEPSGPGEMSQLDPSTCMTLLTTQHVGRLVFGDDDTEVLTIDYRVVDGVITFRTRPDSRAARKDPGPFVFEVDMFDERTRSGWSIVVRGTLAAGGSPDAGDSWALGERNHRMTLAVDTVTGRLLTRDRRNRPRGLRR
jgi:hypothetical protein